MIITFLNSSDTIGSEIIGQHFQALFPSVPILIATILALIITIFVLSHFFYKPIKKLIKKRHDYIQKNIDDALQALNEAQSLKKAAALKLNQSHERALEIIDEAKKRAEKNFEKQIIQVRKDIQREYEAAHQDIAKQESAFQKHAKQEIIDVATTLAKKILRRELTKSTETEIINSFEADLKAFTKKT